MAGQQRRVADLRGERGDGGSGQVDPTELYRSAIDEYRFQVQFNWTRTQYLLIFNAAVLTAAVALSAREDWLAALLYGLGAIAAVLSSIVHVTQHGYYQAARNRVKRVEDLVGVPDVARLDTTGNLGARRVRVKVTLVVNVLLLAMVVADVVGVVVVLVRAVAP